MIPRKQSLDAVVSLLKNFPILAILGPRQCGKTTLALETSFDHRFDLENPRDLARLDQPQLALENLKGLIMIDEIQRKPDLFPLLRYLIDHHSGQKYLILGSASRDLIQQSSESLAGRIGYYYLGGFTLEEVGKKEISKLWVRGGFPRSFIARSEKDSLDWRENFITTFLERDLPQLGIQIPAATLRRFWMMLSHYHGQVVNYSEIGRSFGTTDVTIKKYIDILSGAFMVRSLQPWYVNLGKRLVKNPKIYIRDSGLFHSLQSIESKKQLLAHPKLGASWEGFALEQVIRILGIPEERFYFWATHSGAELDLFWQDKGKNWGAEFKYQDAPVLNRSMTTSLSDLKLAHLYVIYPGTETYSLDKKVTVLPLADFQKIRSS